MRRVSVVALWGSIIPLLVFSSFSQAQLTEYQWVGGTGSKNWQEDANWDLPDFPNDTDPNDMVNPTANLSVALGANLNVSVGTTPVTVAGLTMGGTAGVVSTEISSGGPAGKLTFKNYDDEDSDFNNDDVVTGSDFLIWQRNYGFVNTGPDSINDLGDANADDNVDHLDLEIWQDQYGGLFTPGNAFLTSGGVAGSVNRITAPVHLDDEPLQIDGAIPLVIDTGADISNSAADLESSASISVLRGTVTINSDVIVTNVDTTPGSGGTDLRLRASGDNSTLILNGVVKDAAPSMSGNVTLGGGDGRIEIYGDNDLGGTVRTGGDEIILGHDHALGVSSVAPFTPSHVRPGGTFYSDNDLRNIPNKVTLQSNFNFAGDKTLTLSGEITQTNNRGFNNNIAAPGKLILSGLLNIWEDDEALVREFDFLGTGTTMITGLIRDDYLFSGTDRRINQTGPGVLIIDVGPGDNQHSGPTTITRGNFHYADNDSLNTGGGSIVSHGGAIGVDTGVANNADFAAKIDPISTGGLMLASSDAAVNLDFTITLANAGSMAVAAPETGLTYTGTITPANSTYALGGGTGILTLPNAQLTGANALEVRNEGTVELLGDNTYSGATTIFKKASSTDALTLVVDHLANGGFASGVGSATSDASNLFIQAATLKYVGTGNTTDRLFTIGTGGATIDASGTGALVFNNSGPLARDDAESRTGTLDDASRQPSEIYDLGDTSDIVVGMSVNDPDAGGPLAFPCGGGTSQNCIPLEDPEDPGNPVTVAGVSSDGSIVGMSADVTNLGIFKANTRIVFGTVERTLTLTGTNANDNTLAPIIGDSDGFPLEPDVPVPPGVVSVTKTGSGKWILTGNNTYSGDTTVEEGILSITQAYLDDDSAVNLISGAVFDLDFAGADIIDALLFDDVEQAEGTWGRLGHPSATFTSSFFTSDGLLNVGGVSSTAASAAVPEPGALILVAMASMGLVGYGRRFPASSSLHLADPMQIPQS